MKFSFLLFVISLVMKISIMTDSSLRELTRYKKMKCVMKTRDGKHGIRFLIDKGDFSTDRVLDDCDLALVWKDPDTAFRVLTAGGPTGLQVAEANWELEIRGDKTQYYWFTIFLGFTTGKLKRK